MVQTAFYSGLNRFSLDWATPIPGNVTTYGGPLRTQEKGFASQLRLHEQALFEQLLLFDSLNLNVTGPNLIGPLMYDFMGSKTLEALLEQKAITFVVWQPVPMIAYDKGKVATIFAGSIGDGRRSEFDIEKIVDEGLRLHSIRISSFNKRILRKKLIKSHTVIDQKLPDSVWEVTTKALKAGALEYLGLPNETQPIGLPTEKGEILMKAANSLLNYQYILKEGMVSQNEPDIYDFLSIGLKNLKKSNSPIEKYAVISEFERFPNLRALFGEIEHPFQRIAHFRNTHKAREFRHWLSTAPDSASNAQLIREYVDACGNRKHLFESAPAKFLKLTSMIAISHLAGSEAGVAVGAVLTSIPPSVVNEVLSAAADFGTGVIDSFLIDNLKVGWTPKAYFDGLRRLTPHKN